MTQSFVGYIGRSYLVDSVTPYVWTILCNTNFRAGNTAFLCLDPTLQGVCPPPTIRSLLTICPAPLSRVLMSPLSDSLPLIVHETDVSKTTHRCPKLATSHPGGQIWFEFSQNLFCNCITSVTPPSEGPLGVESGVRGVINWNCQQREYGGMTAFLILGCLTVAL